MAAFFKMSVEGEEEQKLGSRLREINLKHGAIKARDDAAAKQKNIEDVFERVIKPTLEAAIKKDPLTRSVTIMNKALGWDYLMFTYNDKRPRNVFMKLLEAHLAKHELNVGYVVDPEVNHWDRDSIEGIIVKW